MPKLPKFKDFHISPLTGPMNTGTPTDLLPKEQFRYVKNFRVDGAGKLKRAGGFKALLDDGNYDTRADENDPWASGSIKNNTDLHDQLGSKENPTNAHTEAITLLYEFESGGGPRKLIAATKSRIYALNQRSRNWVLIGDNNGAGYGEGISTGYSTTKFKAAQLGNNIIFTNNYDEPLFWFFDNNPILKDASGSLTKNLLQTIPDLVKLKITKVDHLSEYKGFMFLGNLEEASTQQIAKVQWSDFVDATSYYPSLASLSGQQTVGDVGEAIVGMAVLGDHLMVYKERSIWRCSLVSSANLFVFKQVYQGENTPFYPDTLVSVGGAHFYMSERGIYRITVSDIRPVRIDWIHKGAGLIFQDGDTITAEEGYCTKPEYSTKTTCESNSGTWKTTVSGGIRTNKIVQSGDIAAVSECASRPPVITAHPGNLTVNANPCSASYTGVASFSVQSTGKEPFSYQWRKKAASSWSDIPGANERTYTIINPKAEDTYGYEYSVVVTNSDGTATSNAATLTLSGYTSAPSFTLHPLAQSKVVGDSVIFEARFCTAVTAVKWQEDASGTPTDLTPDGTKVIVENGLVERIGSANGYYYSKLTIKNLVSADADSYRCKATNPTDTTYSNIAILSVTTSSNITQDPATGNEEGSASGDTFLIVDEPQGYYDLYNGEEIGYSYNVVGEGADKRTEATSKIKPIIRYNNDVKVEIKDGHPPITVVVAGGKKPYTFEWYISANTSGIQVDHPTAGTYSDSADPQEIQVDALKSSYLHSTVITFALNSGTAPVFTLQKDAKYGDTKLYGILSGTTLPDNFSSANTYDWKPLNNSTRCFIKNRMSGEGDSDKESEHDTSRLSMTYRDFQDVDSYIKCVVKDSTAPQQTDTTAPSANYIGTKINVWAAGLPITSQVHDPQFFSEN